MCDSAVGALATDCQDEFKSTNCAFYRQMGWCKKPDIKKNCMASCGFCTPVIGDEGEEAELPDNRTDGNATAGEKAEEQTYVPGFFEIGIFACLLGCLAYALLVAC
jgi:hypothetical protein